MAYDQTDPNSTGGMLAQGGQLLNQYLTSRNAGNQQQTGIANAIGSTQGMFNQQSNLTTPFVQAGAGVGNAIQANTNPYIGAGQQAIGTLQGLQAPLSTNAFLDPSMKFTMQQGLNATNSAAAAKGGALSGAGLKDLTSYASGLASQNWQNATQNALANRAQQVGIGQSLYTGGQNAINLQEPIYQGGIQALGYQAQNANATQNNLTTLQQNMGNAKAGQTQSQGTNYAQLANQLGNAYNQYNDYSTAQSAGDYVSAESTKMNIRDFGADGIQQPSYAPVAQAQYQAPTVIPIGAGAGGAGGAEATGMPSHAVAQRNTQLATTAANMVASYFSSETTKKEVKDLTPDEVNKSMDGMKAKTYEYTPQAQAQLGMPAGRRAGVMAEDVKQTPAAGMVNDTKPASINIPRATSFALAAVAQLNKRLAAVEGRKKGAK